MMKRILIIVAVMGMAVVGVNQAAHAQVNGWENLRRSNGSLRPDSYTAGRAVQGSQNGGTRGNHPGMAHGPSNGGGHVQRQAQGSHHLGNLGHSHGYGYQPYYNPYRRSVYRYPTYYSRPTYYYRPPVFIPAGRLFGPGAIRMGFGF